MITIYFLELVTRILILCRQPTYCICTLLQKTDHGINSVSLALVEGFSKSKYKRTESKTAVLYICVYINIMYLIK